MKQYSEHFSKRSRLLRAPELGERGVARLRPLDPGQLTDHLRQVLRIQNDFFPCFDWTFPPPLLNRHQPPEDAATLFRHPPVEAGRYSLYLHIPFCKTLCSFCYYTVLPGRGIEQAASYVDYLIREMALYAPTLRGLLCESVYIGGGTPSHLDDALLQRLFEGLHAHFAIADDAEISLEAAPGTLPAAKSALLRTLGVNRLSYGIQTLDADLLATMNRYYSVDEAIAELGGALEHIGNVNVDTMYGFDDEPADALFHTLRRFHELGIPSLSIYSLDTQRSRSGKSLAGPPRDARYQDKIDRFARAADILHGLGYRPVLQNVFTLPGKGSYRHQVRRWDNLPLVALGVSSQGYAPRTPYQNHAALKFWYQSLDAGRLPIATVDHLDAELELIREVASQLRFTQVDLAAVQRRYGVDLDFVFGDLIRSLTELGYLRRDGDRLSMTPAAAYYNNLIPMLFAPDAFKEKLLALPEEYLEEYPVPYVMTRVGCTQSAAIDVRLPGG